MLQARLRTVSSGVLELPAEDRVGNHNDKGVDMGENTRATNAALGCAVACILIWAGETFGHVDIPTAVEGAVVVVATYGTGYLTPPR